VSLRARLILGLLAVALLGLLTLGAVTYVEQRSFLYDRVDQQARGALSVVPARAAAAGGAGFRPFGGGNGKSPDGGYGGFGPGGMFGGDGHGPPAADVGQPAGTFGEHRDGTGKRTKAVVLSGYRGQTTPTPTLPASLPDGKAMTLSAGGHRYRVLAEKDSGGTGSFAVAVPLRETDQTLHRLLLVEGIVVAAVLVALAAIAFFIVRLGLRPLDRMGATAGAIAAGDLTRRVEDVAPRTEVGRLGLALNQMLDRLEEAFAQRQASESRLRRFLADASHELRTPLASIRGYAELFRIGAAREPADVEKAMHRIEQEAARMGVLVEDLLTLARMDQEPVSIREPVDVVQVAEDAVADARAAAPEREIAFDAGEPVVVSGDPHGLHQVLSNLLRNALVHTPEGTAIEVTVTHGADAVSVAVRDHGPGLPEGDPQALFDRFWRSDPARRRGPAGAGLGLAIVAGIVDAHGGSVRAEDAEGGGARFTVTLPVPSELSGSA
jgi:two-component system, OmpR family, sensor kinase